MQKPKLISAMILAAGLGTRLQPLTIKTPKALVPVNGKPMIEHIIEKLISFGIEKIVVNVHHLASQIEEYFSHKNFGIEINLSFEEKLLDTGGGIKNARKYLDGSGTFLVHNVDVFSDTDLKSMFDFHNLKKSLVTLAVKDRKTKRYLLIDSESDIVGRIEKEKRTIYRSLSGDISLRAFSGIHIISDSIFKLFLTEEKFDIVTFYMHLVRNNLKIKAYDTGDAFWEDMGKYKPEKNQI